MLGFGRIGVGSPDLVVAPSERPDCRYVEHDSGGVGRHSCCFEVNRLRLIGCELGVAGFAAVEGADRPERQRLEAPFCCRAAFDEDAEHVEDDVSSGGGVNRNLIVETEWGNHQAGSRVAVEL